MKIIQKSDKVIQVKKGRKVFFEVIESRNGLFYSFQKGLGIVLDCTSAEECLNKTFDRIEYLNNELSKRIISL